MKKSHLLLIPAIAITALFSFGCASDLPPVPANTAAQTSSVPPATTPAAPVAPETKPPVAVAPVTTPAAPVVPEAKPAVVPAGKLTLKVVKVDSEETAGENGAGANAVDGDTATFWHTQWQDNTPPCPHEIIIELVPPATIKGFTYLPRQDDSDHGNIKDYEFYVSADGVDFGQPVKKGTFENSKDLKTVAFDAKQCRFIKLKALSEANDSEWTSAAEITVIRAD